METKGISDWQKIDPEVYYDINLDRYIIPLIDRPTCDMISAFTTNNIKLLLRVKKDHLCSEDGNEFAAFLADDIETFQGQEFGFRFRLDRIKNEYSIYAQNWLMDWWFEFPFRWDLMNPHTYEVDVYRGLFNIVLYKIDGWLRWILLAENKGKPFNLVLTAHNFSGNDPDDWLMYLDNYSYS